MKRSRDKGHLKKRKMLMKNQVPKIQAKTRKKIKLN